MSPIDTRGRFFRDTESRDDCNLVSAVRTTSGTGTAFVVGEAIELEATLVITAASGTSPTVDVRLETTVDGTNYDTVAAFPQQTTTQAGRGKVFAPLGQSCRWAWTIAGTTPSFTFRVDVVNDPAD